MAIRFRTVRLAVVLMVCATSPATVLYNLYKLKLENSETPAAEPQDRCGVSYDNKSCNCIGRSQFCGKSGWCGITNDHRVGDNKQYDCPSKDRDKPLSCGETVTNIMMAVDYPSKLDQFLDSKVLTFLCARDGEVTETATQQYRTTEVKEGGGESWLPVYEKKYESIGDAEKKTRMSHATAATERLVKAIRRVEEAGLSVTLGRGALIGAVRHGGWIDFGGTEYGEGYDTDPDASMSAPDIQAMFRLEKEQPGFWDPFKLTQGEADTSLQKYCEIHCNSPSLAKQLYTDLGVDLSMPNGATLTLDGKPAIEISAWQRWNGTTADKSLLSPFCWRGTQNTRRGRGVALKIPEQRLLPVKRVEFYGIPLPVPQDYTWIISAEWGGDVLRTVKSKTSTKNGGFFGTWVVGEGEKPPPMPIDEQALAVGEAVGEDVG